MKVKSVKNPTWGNAEHTRIDMLVKFEGFDYEIPFSATSDDQEKHCKAIFQSAALGEFGQVAEFVPSTFVWIPPALVAFKFKAVLVKQGFYDEALKFVKSSKDPLVKLAWDENLEFKRTSPIVIALSEKLGLDEKKLDELFVQGFKIEH